MVTKLSTIGERRTLRCATFVQGRACALVILYAAVSFAQKSSPTHEQRAKHLLAASETALSAGDYQSAIDDATEASRIFQALGDGSSQGDAINVAGRAYSYRGDQDAALRAFLRAVELAQQTHDSDQEIGRLNNIGGIYFFQGRYLDALKAYEQALERVHQTAGQPWNPRRWVLTLVNLAVLYEQLGQDQRALELYNQARAMPNALPPSEQAQMFSNLGTLYRRLGDPVKALESYRNAQRLFVQQQHADGEVNVLHNIGILRAQDLSDLRGALQDFTHALDSSQRVSNDRRTTLGHLFRGETYLRMERYPEAKADFQAALTGSERRGAAEEHWTALYGLGRVQLRDGETMAALASFQKAIADIEALRSKLASTSLKSEFLANKRDVYDSATTLLLDRAESPQPGEIFELIEQARARNFKDTLPIEQSRATLRQVQSRLDASTILLEYWLAKDRLAVVWCTRTSAGVLSRRVTTSEMSAVESFGRLLSKDAKRPWRDLSLSVGQVLLRGIEALSNPGIRKLVIVPDGVLHFLPFEVLRRGAREPLMVERFTIWYVPSGASLGSPVGHRPFFPRLPWQNQLAAFGDPLIPAVVERLPSDQQWARLAHSAEEVRQIATLLPGAAELYLGKANTKRRLLERGRPWPPLLHISTHSAVDTTDPKLSRILFSPERDAGSEYLFRSEVQKLKLPGVDLVTLSACETEGGKLVRGEGVQSFSRAFLGAGAASIITTLWRVADQPTAEFMKQFYFHLAEGQTKAAALQAAKLKFLRSGSFLADPRFWAAFVLNGEGDTAVPRYLSWLSVTTGIFGLAIAALFLFRWINSRGRR